jgi:hypothetical protein
MTVAELAQKLDYKIITCENKSMNSNISGVYACDLLSRAMAKVNFGDVWITIHTNLNVVAVASLTEAACVLIPENIDIDMQTVERAEEKGVIFLSGRASTAQACHDILSELGRLP